MPLASSFKRAAVARGLFPDNARLDAPAAFALVRDMPYERASRAAPDAVIEEWRGTCSTKHALLRALLEELGLPSMLIAATHEFTPANSPWLPPHLLAEVQRAPVPDVHNFLRVQAPEGWFAVDATWPLAARDLGMPANERWEPGRNMTIAADIDEMFDVPEDIQPGAFKERLLAQHAGERGTEARERRERFIEALSDWLAGAPSGAPSAQRQQGGTGSVIE